MDASAHRSTRPLAFAATGLIILVTAASVYVALARPRTLNLTARGTPGRAVVSWVAPDGPAWDAGVRPGDTLRDARTVVMRRHGASRVVRFADGPPARAVLLAAGVGLCLQLLGLLVLFKSPQARESRAFWRASMLMGGTLGLLPAGFNGAPWALALTFVALQLEGPALLELMLTFPRPALPPRTWRFLLWVPAVALALLYPLCWWRPLPFFPPVQGLANAARAAYLLATVARVAALVARPRGARERAQLRLLGLGLVGGLAPFLGLTLLPLVITGRALLAPPLTILALALLPVSIAVTIVRGEFLAITSLVRRRTLRVALGVALLAGVASAAGAAVADRPGGLSPALVGGGACALAALLFAPLYRALARRAERVVLRDAYDTAGTLLDLSADLAGAAPGEIGPLVVARLGAILDVSVAALATREELWRRVHPRSAIPPETLGTLTGRMRAMLHEPRAPAAFGQRIGDLPMLCVPVCDGPRVLALMCLGPKRGGDHYSAQDRALLGALARHLAVLFGNQRLRARLDAQIVTLDALADERQVLIDRVVSAEEDERRRLAALLHDEAIQMGGEIVRQVDDLLALPHLPVDAHIGATTVATLGNDLVAQLRQVAGELYPPPLQTAGLVPALPALLHDAGRASGPCCLLDVDPAFAREDVPPDHEVTLYRIAREAVGNALRHAEATTIRVTLARTGAGLTVRVCDDGVGFVPRPAGTFLSRNHLGLALLEQRAREMGGMLELATAPGQGTTVAVTVPVTAPQEQDSEREGVCP